MGTIWQHSVKPMIENMIAETVMIMVTVVMVGLILGAKYEMREPLEYL